MSPALKPLWSLCYWASCVIRSLFAPNTTSQCCWLLFPQKLSRGVKWSLCVFTLAETVVSLVLCGLLFKRRHSFAQYNVRIFFFKQLLLINTEEPSGHVASEYIRWHMLMIFCFSRCSIKLLRPPHKVLRLWTELPSWNLHHRCVLCHRLIYMIVYTDLMKGNNVLSNKHDLECCVRNQLHISLLSMELCKYFDITDIYINGLENMNHINVSI